MSIPAIAMAIPALTKAGETLTNYYFNKQGLQGAKKRTDQEKEYLERLNKRRTKGALDVPKLTNQVANQAYQAGEFAKQNVQGNIVKSGLDNSIVAQELRRKTDVDTMKSIAESSREIAMRNEATKKSAETEYDKYLLTESDRLRNIAMKKAENRGQLASGLIGAVGSGASAVAGGLNWDAIKEGGWGELGKQMFTTQGTVASTGVENLYEMFENDPEGLSKMLKSMQNVDLKALFKLMENMK